MIHDFEKRMLNGQFEIIDTLKVKPEFYEFQQYEEINRGFVKLITFLMICLMFFWLI